MHKEREREGASGQQRRGKIKMATDIASGAVSNARCDVNSGVGEARTSADNRAEELGEDSEDAATRSGTPRCPSEAARGYKATPTIDTVSAAAAALVPSSRDDNATIVESTDCAKSSARVEEHWSISVAGQRSAGYARAGNMSGNDEDAPTSAVLATTAVATTTRLEHQQHQGKCTHARQRINYVSELFAEIFLCRVVFALPCILRHDARITRAVTALFACTRERARATRSPALFVANDARVLCPFRA